MQLEQFVPMPIDLLDRNAVAVFLAQAVKRRRTVRCKNHAFVYFDANANRHDR